MRNPPDAYSTGRQGPGQEEDPARSEGSAVADTEHRAEPERPRDEGRSSGQRPPERQGPGGDREASADPDSGDRNRRSDVAERRSEGREAPDGHREVDWLDYEPAIRRWESVRGLVAPPPTEIGPKGNVRLSPAFVEWMMGYPPEWVTDFGFARKHTFRLLGNGVVPQQAALAIRGLMDEASDLRIGWRDRSGIGLAA